MKKEKTYKYQLTQEQFNLLDGIDKVYYKLVEPDKRWAFIAKFFGFKIPEPYYILKQI